MSATDVGISKLFEFKVLKANRWLFFWLTVLLCSLLFGSLEDVLNPRKSPYQIVDFLRLASLQVGIAGVGITLIAIISRFFFSNVSQDVVNVSFFKCLLILVISLAICEVLLRIVFHDGMTFSFTPRGPIAEKFKSQLTINRFGSRGPDGSHASNADVRVMVIGDSITFGQGIRSEKDLYTTKLLDLLNSDGEMHFDIFALGIPGDEIDAHIRKLDHWGSEIQPDVIIYQWFTNDMELNKSRRTRQQWAVWRKLFFHEFLYRYSYAWFFIDNRLTNLLFLLEDRFGTSYSSYMLRDFGAQDTRAWQHFETLFREWCEKATHLSPRVMVLLYPSLSQLPADGYPFDVIHKRVEKIAGEYNIKTVDLIDYLGDLTDLRSTRANRFDVHPSVMMHERIAHVLSSKIYELWPDLFSTSHEVVTHE